MNHVAKRSGFTLIELMLAMTFISVLLLAIAMTIIQIGTIYNRGVTLKEVSQAARSISDELNRGIASAEAFNLDTNYVTTSAGGRLCTGTYSYIWNYEKAVVNSDNNIVRYVSSNTPIRLVKVSDLGAIYCARDSSTDALIQSDIRIQDAQNSVELLSLGDHSLSLHQFTVTSSDSATDTATGQQLYEVSFTIGTSDLAALNDTQTGCKGPNEAGSDLAYCSAQNFTLVVRAGNRVN